MKANLGHKVGQISHSLWNCKGHMLVTIVLSHCGKEFGNGLIDQYDHVKLNLLQERTITK